MGGTHQHAGRLPEESLERERPAFSWAAVHALGALGDQRSTLEGNQLELWEKILEEMNLGKTTREEENKQETQGGDPAASGKQLHVCLFHLSSPSLRRLEMFGCENKLFS